MALITANVRSQVLDMETQIILTMPDYEENWEEKKPKVVYLLHGMSNNATAWVRGSNIDKYAQDRNFITIMPEVQRSFYTDMEYGLNYFKYVTQELPKIVENLFGIKHDRNNTFVAGLSMGGFGALKIALTMPELFKGVASLSGAIDIESMLSMQDEMVEENPNLIKEFVGIFGEGLLKEGKVTEENNIYSLFDKVNKLDKKEKPFVYMSCGTEDFLYEINKNMKEYVEKLDFDFKYFEGPGDHEWGFWDSEIIKVLDCFNAL